MAPSDHADARTWMASYGDPELTESYLRWLDVNPTDSGDHWQTYPLYLAYVRQPAAVGVDWSDVIGTGALWIGSVGMICLLIVQRWL